MKKLLEWYKKRKENLKGYKEDWRVRFAYDLQRITAVTISNS